MYKTIEVKCHCEHCKEHFNVKVAVLQRYDDIEIRYCPLCGQKPEVIK